MKKRFLVMLMVVAMSVSMFTACGDKEHKYTLDEIVNGMTIQEVKEKNITFDDLADGVEEELQNYRAKYVTIRENSEGK